MAYFNFNLRNPGGVKPSPINFVVRYGKQRLVFPTGEKVQPDQWDADRQRVKGIKKGKLPFTEAQEAEAKKRDELNARLSHLQSVTGELLSAYLTQYKAAPAPDTLRCLLNERLDRTPKEAAPKPLDLFDFIEEYIGDAARRLNPKGKPLHPGTIRIFKRVRDVMKEFKEKKYRKRPFSFEQLDADPTGFYTDYRNFLIQDKAFATNTVGKNLKTVKTFLLEAQARGLLKNFNPRRFKAVAEDADSIFLTEDELDALRALDLTQSPRLDRVRDLFLVGSWTGLRFSDFTRLRPDHLTADGRFFDLTQHKTGQRVKVPVNAVVRGVMGKYEGKTPNSLPPAISNVKMNEYLKELGQLADLQTPVEVRRTKGGMLTTRVLPKWQLLTTHVARRSFATNMLNRNYPVPLIMAITGHKSEAMFWKYVKLTPADRAELFMQLMEQDEQRRAVFKVA